MATYGDTRSRLNTYTHITSTQARLLENVRTGTSQLESSYWGYLMFTTVEYLLIIPLLCPIVLIWYYQHYKRMLRVTELKPEALKKMRYNMFVLFASSFIPIINVVVARRFKGNQRNLQLLEDHLEAEETRKLYKSSPTVNGVIPLPAHVERMFKAFPVFKRDRDYPANSRLSYLSVYASARSSWINGMPGSLGDTGANKTLDEFDDSNASTVINVDVDPSVSEKPQLPKPVATAQSSGWLKTSAGYVSSLWGTTKHSA